MAYFFISNTWKTPHCSSLGRTCRKWSKGVLNNGKRITTSWEAVIEDIDQLLWNVPQWWLCQNTFLSRNDTIVYLESIIKEMSTTETRTVSSKLPTSIFHRCTRKSLHSSSQPRRVFLFAFTVSQYSWTNIIPPFANCWWCIVRHIQRSLSTFGIAREWH